MRWCVLLTVTVHVMPKSVHSSIHPFIYLFNSSDHINIKNKNTRLLYDLGTFVAWAEFDLFLFCFFVNKLQKQTDVIFFSFVITSVFFFFFQISVTA